MSMNEKKVPKRRFKEFQNAGAWEQRKLHNETNSIDTGKSKFVTKERGPYEILGSTSVIGYDDTYDYEGDFLLTARVGANAGELYRHTGKVKISDNTVFIQGDNLDFTYYLLMNFDIKKLSFGTGQPLVKASELKEQNLMFPSINEERVRIGMFFRKFDNLITLHQRKLDKLKSLKKAYLTDMFPAEGESKPKLRFAGFNDDWERCKLSDIAEIISGGTPNTNNDKYWDGDINWYSPAEIGEEVYAFESQKKITKLGLEKSSAKMLPAEKTILFSSRAGIGSTAILKSPGTTNQGFQSLVLKNGYNTYFVYSMTPEIKKYAERVAAGSTFLEISGKLLGNMDILMPIPEEQNQIGEFFCKIDNLITLHQRKLEKLQNIKKAYLSEMFI